MMTRFERELSGEFGEYWKDNAEAQIREMQYKADNGYMGTDPDGAVYWVKSGNYLPSDSVEALKHTDFHFSPEATEIARHIQVALALERYSQNRADERVEMRTAFGRGTILLKMITGEKIRV